MKRRKSRDKSASARADARVLRAERVDVILDSMARGEWSTKIALDKAIEWGMQLSSVQNLAISAGEVLRHARLGDLETIRALHIASLERIREAALSDPEHPNYGAAVRAQEAQAALIPGLVLQQKSGPAVQIGHVTVTPAEAKAIDAELAEWEPLKLEPPSLAGQASEEREQAKYERHDHGSADTQSDREHATIVRRERPSAS